MDTKLTLKLDQSVIIRAKKYARKKEISLSHLIEVYLKFITNPKENEDETTPLVKGISGILSVPKYFKYKKAYKTHLSRKYGK